MNQFAEKEKGSWFTVAEGFSGKGVAVYHIRQDGEYWRLFHAASGLNAHLGGYYDHYWNEDDAVLALIEFYPKKVWEARRVRENGEGQ